MKCTICGHTAYHPRLRPVGWVCVSCFHADAGYSPPPPRRAKPRNLGTGAGDPACTCGHPFSAHPPSPLYACGVEGCSCNVYTRNWSAERASS